MLDRTSYSQHPTQGLTIKRKEDPISFPLTNLDFGPYCSDPKKKSCPYELIALIMHSGTHKNGHYTSYVKINAQWYYCNDSEIQSLAESEIAALAQRGYGIHPTVLPTTLVYKRTQLPL